MLLALVDQAQVVERDLGLVGELRRAGGAGVGVEAVLVVEVAGLRAAVALELAHRVAEAPAERLLGEDLGAGDALEHAVDDAALEVAERRARRPAGAGSSGSAELDEHALLVELDLELAELHVARTSP